MPPYKASVSFHLESGHRFCHSSSGQTTLFRNRSERSSERMDDKAGSVLHGRMKKLSLVSLAAERPRRDAVVFITQHQKE